MDLLMAMALVSVISRPVANMYSNPTEDADVVSQALYGATVSVVEEKAGWVKIRTPDDYTGWTPAAWVRKGAAYASGGRLATVSGLFANVYRESDVTRHAPVLTLPFEARLEVTGESGQGRWLSVRLVDGGTAWVQRGDVALDPKPITMPQMLEVSKRFLGLTYTWGGTSTFGYDCSGFVQMLYRQMGVVMPRDAGPQAAWSGVTPVERNALQPGDLLYFGSSAQKITHTGMYLGNGEFINATTYEHPSVKIDRLTEPRWTKLLVACRRVKGAPDIMELR